MTDKQPSKKQIDILIKNGYTYEQVSAMPYQEISTKIGEIFNNSGIQTNNAPKVAHNPVFDSKKASSVTATEVINKTERPNSYEFGKAGSRVKFYFETIEELKEKIREFMEFQKELDTLNLE